MIGRKRRPPPGAPPPGGREVLAFLGPALRPERLRLAALIAGSLLLLLAACLSPWVQRGLIDALTARQQQQVVFYAGLTLLLLALKKILDSWQTVGTGVLHARLGVRLKKLVFRRLLDLPVSFLQQSGAGYLSGRLNQDIDALNSFCSFAVIRILSNFGKFIGGLALLFLFDWRIGGAMLIVLPFFALPALYFRRSQYRLSYRISEKQAKNQRKIHNYLARSSLLKTQASEKHLSSRMELELDNLGELRIRRLRLETVFRMFMQVIPTGCYVLVSVYGIWMILEGRWSLGKLWAINCYLMLIFSPVLLLASSYLQAQIARAAAARLLELDRVMPEQSLDEGIVPAELAGDICFDRVSFGYSDRQTVLDRVSFHLAPAEKAALAGVSGSGKTTLVGLLLRLYHPSGGEIRIDGRKVEEYNLRALRRRIGYLGQTTEFIHGTIRENLTLGKSIREDRLAAVLAAVDMAAAIGQLPDKLQTVIREDGSNFSVGERLRLALAREMLQQPDIMIMDEITANLDRVNEAKVIDIIHKHFAKSTVLVISHRASTLAAFRRVLTLAGGKVSEGGSEG